MSKDKIVLSVAVRAFNQEVEVIRALNSIVAQKVNFSIEIVVGVDKSKDKTLDVVKDFCHHLSNTYSYHIIEHPENIGGARNWVSVVNACKGKYIAILDGDDYWVDSEKCVEQISIMEQNPQIGLVYADNYIIGYDGVKKENISPDPSEDVFNQMLKGNFVTSSTVMFRNRSIDFSELVIKRWRCDDYYTWLDLAANTDFYHLKKYVLVYTRNYDIESKNDFSKAQGADAYWRKCVDVCKYYVEKYPNKSKLTEHDLLSAYYWNIIHTGVQWRKWDYIQEAVSYLLQDETLFKRKVYLFCLSKKWCFIIYMIYRKQKNL